MNLEDVRTRQIDRLVRARYPELVGIAEEAYRSAVPPLLEPPPRGPDVPLLIDPRPTLEAQLGRIRARAEVEVSSFHDRQPVPAEPYWIWVDRGTGNVGKKPLDCRKAFGPRERGLTITEAVHWILQEPSVLNRFGMDLLGTVAQSQFVFPESPYFFLAYGTPLLSQRRESEASGSLAIPFCVVAGRAPCRPDGAGG